MSATDQLERLGALSFEDKAFDGVIRTLGHGDDAEEASVNDADTLGEAGFTLSADVSHLLGALSNVCGLRAQPGHLLAIAPRDKTVTQNERPNLSLESDPDLYPIFYLTIGELRTAMRTGKWERSAE